MVAESLPILGHKSTFVPFHIYCNIAKARDCAITSLKVIITMSSRGVDT